MPAGGLVKLKLTGYSDDGFSTKAAGPIFLAINPSSYSVSTGIEYDCDAAAGSTGKTQSFNRLKGSTLGFDIVFDGTGTVDGPVRGVDDQIADLRTLALTINGKIHRPNYVRLVWGTMCFDGQLSSLAIDYTLFAPNGTPLRAKAKASFLGVENPLQARIEQGRSSPDMSHVVTVAPGDTLPLMCARVYGDSAYYIAVAAANGLTGFRGLPVGTQLLFPPLAGPTT